MVHVKLLAFTCIIAILAGCKTPIEKQVNHFETGRQLMPEIQYIIEANFKPNDVNCIAVGKFLDLSEKSEFKNLKKPELVRRSVYGILSAKNYVDIELSRVDYVLSNPSNNVLDALRCDALLTGQINKFENASLVAYSVTTVELELKLTSKNGQTLWTGKHAANSREGTLPLSPISLISGVFAAEINKQDEVALQMIDAAARRIMNTLPDRDELEMAAAFTPQFSSNSYEDSKKESDSKSSAQLLSQGKYEEALKRAKQEAKEFPNDEQPLIIASRASLLLGNFKYANNYAMKAVIKNETNREALTALGSSYVKLKKFKLAEGTFIKLIRSKDNKPHDWFHLALVQAAQNDLSAAADNLLKAGKIGLQQEDNITTFKSLKKLKAMSKKSEKAFQNYGALGLKVSKYLDLKRVEH
jgi:Flp pilus assembly protein TadD